LSDRSGASPFDPVRFAEGEDLVAVGGTLAPPLVLDAYRHGIFPWYGADEPVLWWSPDPRGVLGPDDLRVPRRLERTIRSGRFATTADRAFEETMRACAARPEGTWIHEEMIRCYRSLHEEGHAHSLETWRDGRLVGGVYGVAVGSVFCAESKFHRERDASKVVLVALARRLFERGFDLLEVQFLTPHLAQFGCREISREEYLGRLAQGLARSPPF
jgi:leucyl/phenylalanyl-tRNA--protein transferase